MELAENYRTDKKDNGIFDLIPEKKQGTTTTTSENCNNKSNSLECLFMDHSMEECFYDIR